MTKLCGELIYLPTLSIPNINPANISPDMLSYLVCLIPTTNTSHKVHDALCHPGVVPLLHFVKMKNLPYSIDDIKRVVSNCKICCECKLKFFKPCMFHLVKAT